MHTLTSKSLELAVQFHLGFNDKYGFQSPDLVVDTAKVFMLYLKSAEDNSPVNEESCAIEVINKNLPKRTTP